MDMSLAEDAQETMATLAPDRFFFMSPYRSFTTSGCFARYTEPAVAGDSPDSPFQQKLRQQFAEAKSQGIANPILVGAIPLIPASRRRYLSRWRGSPFPASKSSARRVILLTISR